MRVRLMALGGSAAVITFTFFLAVLLYSGGCGPGKTDGKSPSGNKVARQPALRPLLKDWEKPAFALVLSAEQYGYLEPCGCTAESQMGGLAHRADLFRRLREERKWDVAGLDAGGLVTLNPRNPDENDLRKQDQIKLTKTLEALKTLGYQAVGLGTRELRLALPQHDLFLLTLNNLMPADTGEVPFVSANAAVVNRDEKGKVIERIGPRQTHLFTVGGKKIGVTAVMGSRMARTLAPQGANLPIAVDNPQVALRTALEKLQAQQPDFLILLASAELDEARELAKAFPQFQVILSSGGPQEGLEEPERVGNTLLICVGTKGKHVGVLGFYPEAQKAEQRLKFELVELDAHRFHNDPRMIQLMRDYQSMLQAEEEALFADVRFGPHPTGRTFVGVAQCKDCHKKAYAKWITTKHAHAYQSLLKGRPDQKKEEWVPRNHDPECLACHVTGWDPARVRRYDSGFLVKSLADRQNQPQLYTALQGQQCENCHGPGSRHVELEWEFAKNPVADIPEAVRQARLALQLHKEEVEKSRTCYRCHDLDNSPRFNFERYWREIEHKGKD